MSLFCIACKQPVSTEEKTAGTPAASDSADADRTYLPVNSFIQEERKKVESFAAGILKKTNDGRKQDSAFISFQEFLSLSQPFDLQGFDSAYFTNHYTENSFLEQSTGTVQFLYGAREATNPIPKIILYIQQKETGDKVDMIYIERNAVNGDTSVSRRLSWKLGHYFIIVTNKETNSGYRNTTTERVIWEASDFGAR